MSAKVTPESVDYSKGMGDSRCKNCLNYEPNETVPEVGTCRKVLGIIHSWMWCELFSKRPPQTDD